MFEYAYLLAARTKQYGGVSPEVWLDALTRDAGSSKVDTRRRFRPLADDLAAISGYDQHALPLLAGRPSLPGALVLELAHRDAFGHDLSAATILAALDGDGTVAPADRIAGRLAERGSRLFRQALRDWLAVHLPAIRPDDVDAWLALARPDFYVLPTAACSLSRAAKRALDDSLYRAAQDVGSTILGLVERVLGGTVWGEHLDAQISRCCDPHYLGGRIRPAMRRGLEMLRLFARRTGGTHGDLYVSSETLADWHVRKRGQLAWMKSTWVFDSTGRARPRKLIDVVPDNSARRAETHAVLAGIDNLAVEAGMLAALVTVTLPPEWHVNPTVGSNTWAGTGYAPDDGARRLAADWANYLRYLANADIRIAGLRAMEAHKDGTLHMHALVYYHPDDESETLARLADTHNAPAIKIRTAHVHSGGTKKTKRGVRYDVDLTHYDVSARAEKPGDGGRPARRIEWSRINRDVAHAASYVAKYVQKSIDFDELGAAPPKRGDKTFTAKAAAAHAAVWRYHRYEFFGVQSSLTLWRALRRRAADSVLW